MKTTITIKAVPTCFSEIVVGEMFMYGEGKVSIKVLIDGTITAINLQDGKEEYLDPSTPCKQLVDVEIKAHTL